MQRIQNSGLGPASLSLLLLPLLLLLLAGPFAHAQGPADVTTSALGDLSSRLGQPDTGRSDSAAATRFTPTGKLLTLDSFLDSLPNRSPEERQSLRQVLQAVFDAYEKAAAAAGHSNDVAAALTFYLTTHYTAYHDGKEVSSEASAALLRQLHGALDTPSVRAETDEDKQKMYEFLVLMGGFTGAMRELGVEQKDATMQQAARQLGANGLKSLLHIAPERVRITTTGLSIAPDPAVPAKKDPQAANEPAGAAGTVSLGDITYRIPAGWSENKTEGAVTLYFKGGDASAPQDCSLILAPGFAKAGSLPDSLYTIWRDTVLTNYEGEAKPFPYVSQLAGGLNCVYGVADMRKKASGASYAISGYAIDAGSSVVFVMVIYSTRQSYIGGNKAWTGPIQQFFDSLKVRGAPTGRPAVTRSDLAGTWSTTSTSIADYVTSRGDYAGDASITTAESFTFHSDGTFSRYFFGMNSTSHVQEKENGTYRIAGDVITLTDKATGRVTNKYFLGRGAAGKEKKPTIYLRNVSDRSTLFATDMYDDPLYLTPK